jgi:hypothetical protein
MLHGQSPPSATSRSSRWKDPTPQVPQRGPYMERHSSQNLLPHISPQHMTPLPGFLARPPWKEVLIPEPAFTPPGSPNRAPVRRDAPFPDPSFQYLSQFRVNGPPPQVPHWDPYREIHPSTEPSTSHPLKINLSLGVPGNGAPSMFLNRIPMERVSPSPELLVYSCMSARVPKQGALLQNGEKHKVTVHRASRRQKACIQWGMAWFPKGIVNDTISTPLPCSPWHDTFH